MADIASCTYACSVCKLRHLPLKSSRETSKLLSNKAVAPPARQEARVNPEFCNPLKRFKVSKQFLATAKEYAQTRTSEGRPDTAQDSQATVTGSDTSTG